MAAKVLLVEDDRVERDLLSKYLQLVGFEVLASGSGEEAISVALRDHPDVILMDLGLPGMSGIEAAEVIKQSGQVSNIPIIALSGRPRNIWEQSALSAGMSSYLAKPASAADIVEAIKDVLRAASTAGAQKPRKPE